jgi:hypothetical protein
VILHTSKRYCFERIKLMFWDEIGAVGTQAMFEALCEQGGYKHL